MRALAPVILVGLSLAGPAWAQIERLPSTSRSERQTQDINRSLLQQNRQLNQDQQIQTEINSIRRQIQREITTPPLPPPSFPSSPCGPGGVGCR